VEYAVVKAEKDEAKLVEKDEAKLVVEEDANKYI
jgi:hypothetical protein